MHRFLEEIRRRNVHRVATTYALSAWILIEAGSVLLPTFGIPDSFFKTYVIIVSAGFAITLILSWVFEVTPDGVKLERTAYVVPDVPASHASQKEKSDKAMHPCHAPMGVPAPRENAHRFPSVLPDYSCFNLLPE